MKFEQIIQELGRVVGIGDLTLDASRSCTLCFDEKYTVTFCHDADDRAVLFHCEVGDSSKLGKNECIKLLESSLLGARTGGGALSIHSELNKVVLWKRFNEEFANYADFERSLNDFLGQVKFWMQELNKSGQTESGEQSQTSVNPMQAFGMRI